MSAAYSAGARYGVIRDYDNKCSISLTAMAQLNPEKADAAIPYFKKGMEETIQDAVDNDLAKIKEILLKQAGVDAKTNSHWLDVLNLYVRYGVDEQTGYKEMVKNITEKEISDFLQNTMLKSGNHFQIIMKAVKE